MSEHYSRHWEYQKELSKPASLIYGTCIPGARGRKYNA